MDYGSATKTGICRLGGATNAGQLNFKFAALAKAFPGGYLWAGY
jgi:hypothetical protein